jgi:hypothetical protein
MGHDVSTQIAVSFEKTHTPGDEQEKPYVSVSWVKDWKRVFRRADPDDEALVLGRPRYRRTPLDAYDADVIAAVLDIRDNPPAMMPDTSEPPMSIGMRSGSW